MSRVVHASSTAIGHQSFQRKPKVGVFAHFSILSGASHLVVRGGGTKKVMDVWVVDEDDSSLLPNVPGPVIQSESFDLYSTGEAEKR